jgi:hypothetical protein
MSDVGGHPGLLGAFAIAELSDGHSIVYLETAADGQTVEAPETVREIQLRFNSLRTDALTGRASLTLIERLAEEWKQ